MNAITIDKALSDFPGLIENVVTEHEETFIVSDYGTVVMIGQNEWNSILETIKLLRDKESLKSLLEGHSIRRKGKQSVSKTVEQAFYDLQDIDS